jgi:hypothetical protein
MIKRFGLPALALAIGLISPGTALAKHHGDDEWREHERHEWREHQPRFRDYYYSSRPGFYFSYGPSYAYGPGYAGGYYDRWGRWHPYARGYFDRWGYWHPYGY